jgi:acyl-CoA synthetase (NDP forming)
VLKAAGRDRTAKTAAAGFAIDLEDPDGLAHAWERMSETFGEGLGPALVQPMLPPGVDVAVAVHDHPTVGPVLSLGPGGAAAALDAATDLRVLPVGDAEVARLIDGCRLAPMLDDDARDALAEVVLRVGALVEEVPEVVALELNPVMVRAGRAVVTQVRATVRPVARDPRPPVRRV